MWRQIFAFIAFNLLLTSAAFGAVSRAELKVGITITGKPATRSEVMLPRSRPPAAGQRTANSPSATARPRTQ